MMNSSAQSDKHSEHALITCDMLLHVNEIDEQTLNKLEAAAKGWNTEASGAEYWLYMLDHRREQDPVQVRLVYQWPRILVLICKSSLLHCAHNVTSKWWLTANPFLQES